MRNLILFNMVTIDGYFEGMHGDIRWHKVDEEVNEYFIDQLRTSDTLLFGRRTYMVMEDYWDSEAAMQEDPVVTEMMGNYLKIIFSTTLQKTGWKNTRIINRNAVEEIEKLKAMAGKDIFIFGSAELSHLLAQHQLIDEFRLMINPVILGNGIPLFKKKHLELQLKKAKVFGNGNVLLCYIPA